VHHCAYKFGSAQFLLDAFIELKKRYREQQVMEPGAVENITDEMIAAYLEHHKKD
jgi:hypothetical protein